MENNLTGLNQYKETLDMLPKENKKYVLLEIGAQFNLLKNHLPCNMKYISLDMDGESDYNIDLNNESIPFKNKSFDIIVCLEVLEHTLHPYYVMKEITRVLKDDGIMIMSMPNEYNFYLRLFYLFGKKINQIHEPFKIVDNLRHIHNPRVCDIIDFFNNTTNVKEIRYTWQSGKCINSKFFYNLDKMINLLAQVYPSMFCRMVIVKSTKRKE